MLSKVKVRVRQPLQILCSAAILVTAARLPSAADHPAPAPLLLCGQQGDRPDIIALIKERFQAGERLSTRVSG